MLSPRSKSSSRLPEAIFSLGAIITILGGLNYFSTHFSSEKTDVPLPVSSNTQRNLAIQEALKTGQKTYQYESGFIPGVGNIPNSEEYKKQFEERVKNDIQTE